MYQTGIRDRFSATHHLIGDFAAETQSHAHDYLVDWRVEAPALDADGFGVDIDVMTRLLRELLASLDGTHLNDMPDLAGGQPSVERLAEALCGRLLSGLREAGAATTLTCTTITIWESEVAYAGYSTELP